MSLIEDAKKVINGYYLGQYEKLYIPEDIVSDVFRIAMDSASDVQHFCLYSKQIEKDKMYKCVKTAGQLFPKKIKKQCIAVKSIKSLDKNSISFMNCKNNIKQGIILLSNVNIELLPPPFNFVLFDSKFALVLDPDQDGGYYFASNIELINECKNWLSVQMITTKELNSCFLQEPLIMSADMMSEVALVMCTHDHMNIEGCYWYHSVWQYLRLMNLVSTPSWHHDFYMEQICKATELVLQPVVLISGAADYSTLSYVIKALDTVGKKGVYDVLDLCKTPLFSCEWYAKRENNEINTMQISIFDLSIKNKYNLICTDAFLTRFSQQQLLGILNIWQSALKQNGEVVTTIRVHDEDHYCPDNPSNDAVRAFVNKAKVRSKIWNTIINYSEDDIANKAEIYARKMRSNRVGTKNEILDCFQSSGFCIEFVETVEVSGELYPSKYLRIRAKKTGD